MVVVSNLLVDALFVAWIAGWRAKKEWTKWLSSKKADPYIDRVASRTLLHVKPEVERVEREMGEFEARMNAQMPPNVDGRIKEVFDLVTSLGTYVREQMAAFADEFERLPDRLKMLELAERSVEARALARTMDGVTEEVEGQVRAEIASDPRMRGYERILRYKLPAGYEEKNPVGAMIFEEVRDMMAERRLRGKGGDGGYSGSSKGQEM